MSDGADPKKAGEPGATTKPSEAIVTASKAEAVVLPPELVQAARSNVDLNVILLNVTQRLEPQEIVAATREVFALTEEYERKNVELFKVRTEAINEAKRSDPDEIEKRLNNRIRRWLKLTLAGLTVLSVGGGIACIFLGGNVVTTGLLLGMGPLGIALMSLLASGESVSSGDVVRVLGAMTRLRSSSNEPPAPQLPSGTPRRKGKRR